MTSNLPIEECIESLRQSLNLIALVGYNTHIRIVPNLESADATYADRKLKQIEAELARMNRTLDTLTHELHSTLAG